MSERSAPIGPFLTAIRGVIQDFLDGNRLLNGRYSAPLKLDIALLAVLVLAIIGFYGAFIRPGVTWADDWATYVQDALNLLHGSKYSATGYVFNPDLDIGPTAYPPLYPLSLTLPIALWGVNFHAIREFQLLFWAIFLAAVYFVARRRLSSGCALIVVAGIGLSPYFFEFKDYIASEALFLALLYVAFVLAARFEETAPNGDMSAGRGVWLGLVIALCIATRSAGLVLLPTFAGYDLLRSHRLRKGTIIAIAIAALSFVLQLFLVDFFNDYMVTFFHNSRADIQIGGQSATPSFVERLAGAFSLITHRLYRFLTETSCLWSEGSHGALLPRIVSIVFGASAIYGFGKAIKRDFMHCDVFAVLYCVALLALPAVMAGARMQMPLYPLLYIYMAVTIADIDVTWVRQVAAIVVLSLGVGSYLQSYGDLDFRSPLVGLQTSNYRDMFEYIRRQTEPDSTLIFDKPRTLALYTQRRAAAIYDSRKGDDLVFYMHKIHARYILFYDLWQDGQPRNQYINKILGRRINDFRPVHDSGHFVLYKMKSPPSSASPDARAVKTYENSDHPIWRVAF